MVNNDLNIYTSSIFGGMSIRVVQVELNHSYEVSSHYYGTSTVVKRTKKAASIQPLPTWILVA